MIDKTVIRAIIEAYLVDKDQYLVDVWVSTDNRIVVEIDSEQGIAIDDCVVLTKHIEGWLDRDIEDYELEVGSAGITQPFKVLRQYQKNVGNKVEVLLRDGKKEVGILTSADEEKIVLTTTKLVKLEGAKRKSAVEEATTYTYKEIKSTKYVIEI
jgi:ribosome maturation factor RimP